jgi:predicted Zn-dependent peptidase
VTKDALLELLRELKRIRDEPVPGTEFQAAQRSIVASFALSLESPATLLNNSVVRYLYDLPIDYWDRYPERIMSVTPQQVQDVAARYLDSDRLQVIAVGNGEEITSMLQSFGAVEVYDDQGVFVETIGVSR